MAENVRRSDTEVRSRCRRNINRKNSAREREAEYYEQFKEYSSPPRQLKCQVSGTKIHTTACAGSTAAACVVSKAIRHACTYTFRNITPPPGYAKATCGAIEVDSRQYSCRRIHSSRRSPVDYRWLLPGFGGEPGLQRSLSGLVRFLGLLLAW